MFDAPLLIAEIGQAHDGSLGAAHAYIDAAASSGAGAVKFQTHIARYESSQAEPWRVKFSLQDATRYHYWRRMEFSAEQWGGLKDHAEEAGLLFLSSPFSVEAVDLLEKLGMKAYKIASGELTNPLLLARVAATGKPVLLSTGMATWDEIDRAVEMLSACPLAVLQCTSKYPVTPAEWGLNLLDAYRQAYHCAVGISDHSGTIYPGLAAAALGASVVEVHLTFSRACFGPDVPASLTPAELAQLAEGMRAIRAALDHPVSKDHVAGTLDATRQTFGKALVAARDLPAGLRPGAADLTARKPASAGIPAARLDEFTGQKLRNPVQAGDFLQEADFA